MHQPELAICLDDLRLDIRPALRLARARGFRAVDISAVRGPVSPGELTGTGQRHLLKHLDDLGLRLASLRGPVGGQGYGDGASGERRLDTLRRIIALGAALRVPVVSTTLGPSPEEDAGTAEAAQLREALAHMADDADRAGVTVAVETAGIRAAALNRLLAEINCPAVTACCDSGAMLMQGDDPHDVARTLPGRIGLVRARDAVRGRDATGYEVAQGEGSLDPARFLAALVEAGFRGDVVLSRTAGTQPADDLSRARSAFEQCYR